MRKILVFAGLLAAPGMPVGAQTVSETRKAEDPRVSRLEQFFAQNNCRLRNLASDFIEAADRNALDWRLLPSISLVESGGGKAYKNNNVFGWRSGREKFTSIRESIHQIAFRLGNSKLYRNKNTEAILKTYNPYTTYTLKVKNVMQLIGPADFTLAAAAVVFD